MVPAQRAYEMGLVNRIVPDGEHLEAALGMARILEGMAPLVLKTLKRFVTEQTLTHTPSERMARSLREIDVINQSADLQEGIVSFTEKREAVFKGR